jgi:hypothetical protein
MQETESSLSILIQKVGNNILILLSLFNRKERFLQPLRAAILLLIALFVPALKRGKLRVHTHQTSTPAHILIDKSSNQVDHAHILGFCSHVQKNNVLWVEVPAEPLKEPQMRGKLSSVEMLETTEYFQIFSTEILASPRGVCHARVPQILVQKRDILFNRGREISIIADIAAHTFSIVVINLIQNGVDAFLKIALRFSVQLIQSLVELHHRVLLLLVAHISALAAVADQFQDTVLHEHHRHLLARDSLSL